MFNCTCLTREFSSPKRKIDIAILTPPMAVVEEVFLFSDEEGEDVKEESVSVNWIDTALLECPDEDSICVICSGVMVDPVICCAQGHSFCRSCCVTALDHDKRCPVCRKPADKNELVPNITARNLIAKLPCRCSPSKQIGADNNT